MRRPRVAPVPTIPDLQLTADRALSLHRPTRWQAQGQLCACRSLSLSLLPEVTSLDLHATEIAADRAMHPSTGSGQALRQAQGRPSPTGWLTSATLRFTDCAVLAAAWPSAQPGDDPPNGLRFTCAAKRSGAASGASACWAATSFEQGIPK